MQNDNEEVRNRLRVMSQEAAQKEAWLEDQQERHARRERSVSQLQGPLGPTLRPRGRDGVSMALVNNEHGQAQGGWLDDQQAQHAQHGRLVRQIWEPLGPIEAILIPQLMLTRSADRQQEVGRKI